MPIPMLLFTAAETASQNLSPLQKTLGGLGFGPLMIIIFLVFYLLVMRPQQQKQQQQQRDHESWQKSVGAGEEVVTQGGLVGTSTHAGDDVVTIEVGDKVRVRVLRTHLTGPLKKKESDSKDKASA